MDVASVIRALMGHEAPPQQVWAPQDKLRNYMRGMNTLASGTYPFKSAGQYGAQGAQEQYDYTRKLVGLGN